MNQAERSMILHWSSVQPDHTKLVEFFDWLEEQGIEVEMTRRDDGSPVWDKPSDLALRFLEVDPVQLEAERRALVESLT